MRLRSIIRSQIHETLSWRRSAVPDMKAFTTHAWTTATESSPLQRTVGPCHAQARRPKSNMCSGPNMRIDKEELLVRLVFSYECMPPPPSQRWRQQHRGNRSSTNGKEQNQHQDCCSRQNHKWWQVRDKGTLSCDTFSLGADLIRRTLRSGQVRTCVTKSSRNARVAMCCAKRIRSRKWRVLHKVLGPSHLGQRWNAPSKKELYKSLVVRRRHSDLHHDRHQSAPRQRLLHRPSAHRNPNRRACQLATHPKAVPTTMSSHAAQWHHQQAWLHDQVDLPKGCTASVRSRRAEAAEGNVSHSVLCA